jgi:hypothetical protein
MVTELIVTIIFVALIVGMFFGTALRRFDSRISKMMNNELRKKLETIAMDLRTVHKVKHNYVVIKIPNTRNHVYVQVKEFCEDHIVFSDGTFSSYSGLNGYCNPPLEVVESIRNFESGLTLQTKKIITN